MRLLKLSNSAEEFFNIAFEDSADAMAFTEFIEGSKYIFVTEAKDLPVVRLENEECQHDGREYHYNREKGVSVWRCMRCKTTGVSNRPGE